MFGSLYYLLSLDDNSKSRVVDTMILACMIIVFYYIAQTLRFGPSMNNCMSKDPAFRSCVQILRSDSRQLIVGTTKHCEWLKS